MCRFYFMSLLDTKSKRRRPLKHWIKVQQFNYYSYLSFTEHNPQIQSNRCHFNDRIVLTRFVIPVMFVFAPLP